MAEKCAIPTLHYIILLLVILAANYWALLSDLKKLIKNPGLKHGVKANIGAPAGIVADWKKDFIKDSKVPQFLNYVT